MSIPGEVQAFDGLTLGAGLLANVTGLVRSASTENAKADTEYAQRPGGSPEFTQSTVAEHTIEVAFKFTGYSGKKAILQMLGYPNTRDPKVIRVYQGDPDDVTLCAASVAVQDITQEAGEITVIFTKADALWVNVEGVVLSDLMLNDSKTRVSASKAFVLWNEGHVQAKPTYKIGWYTQRSTSSASEGWKYWRTESITNSGSQDWHDEPMVVDLGDTGAWVTATKALSSGNDVRVIIEGEDKPRTLTCFNTERSFVWFLLSLAAGESVTVYVWYGNPDAGSPQTLSLYSGTNQTYCAIDLEGDSGTATSGSTSQFTDTSKNWETDEWKNGYFFITGGGGDQRGGRIASNDSDTINFNRGLSSSANSSTTYVIFKSGIMIDGGRVTTTGALTITDNVGTLPFGDNSLKGATAYFLSGTTANPTEMTVASNTGTTITFTSSFSVNPTVGDSFRIEKMGLWSWHVDTTVSNRDHRGVYRENRYYSQPSRTWANGDTPGGWQLATRLPGVDTYAHYKPFDTGSDGGHAHNWWPNLRARRKVKQSSRLYANVGNADGLEIYSPFKFQSLYWDWKFKNINGQCAAMCSVMDSGGQGWADVVTDTTTYASLTSVAAQWADLSEYDNPTRIYQGVLPADGVEIPTSAAITDEGELRWDTTLVAVLSLSTFGGLANSRYVVGNETEIYDLTPTLRLGGGGADLSTPRDEIQIGGSGHRIGLESDQQLWIDTDPAANRPLFGVYTDGVLDYSAAWAGVIYRIETDLDGTEVETETMEFAPVPPSLNMIDNGLFTEQDVSMWTMTLGSGVTAAKSWKATPLPTSNSGGVMEIDITVTPGGAWTVTLEYPTITVVPQRSYDFGFAYRTDDNGNSLSIVENVYWNGDVDPLDLAQQLGGAPVANDTWYFDVEGNETGYVPPGFVAVGTSTVTANVEVVISGTGSYTGKVYLGAFSFGVPALYVSESNIGTLTIDAVYQEALL